MRRSLFSFAAGLVSVRATVHVLVVSQPGGALSSLVFDDSANTLKQGAVISGAGGPDLAVSPDATRVAVLNTQDQFAIFSVENSTGALAAIGSPESVGGQGAISIDISPKGDAIAVALNVSNEIVAWSFANDELGVNPAATEKPAGPPSQVKFDLSSTYVFAPVPASAEIAQFMTSGQGALQAASPVTLPSQESQVQPALVTFASAGRTRMFVGNTESDTVSVWSMCYSDNGAMSIASAEEVPLNSTTATSASTAPSASASTASAAASSSATAGNISSASGPPCALQAAPNGETLLAGLCSGSVVMLSISQDDTTNVLTTAGTFSNNAPISALDIEPIQGQYVAVASGSAGSVTIYSMTASSASQVATLGGLSGVAAVKWAAPVANQTVTTLASGCSKASGNLGSASGSGGVDGSKSAAPLLSPPLLFLLFAGLCCIF